MNKYPWLLLFCFLIGNAVLAQEATFPRDTSYTVASTYLKLKKQYPFIKPVSPQTPNGVKERKDIVYRKFGNRELHLDVFYPAKNNKKGYPAVLLIHGGGWRSGDKKLEWPMAQQLAAQGYVTVTAEYRLSLEAPYPAAVNDLKAALRWMRAHAKEFNIDTTRFATYGTSAGGQLAALVGTTNSVAKLEGQGTYPNHSSAVQAIVDVDGVLAFKHPDSSEGTVAAQWLGGTSAEAPQTWAEASALTHVGKNTPPILFIASSHPRFHAGKGDMMKVLEAENIYHESYLIPDTPHSFWLFSPWFEPTLQYTLGFLNKVFKEEDRVAREPYPPTLTVAQDGSGDYITIQEAVNSVRDLGEKRVEIHIRKGTYNEKLIIPSWKTNISLIGESPETTIITWNDHSGKPVEAGKGGLGLEKYSTFTSYTVLVQGNDVILENLTIQNTAGRVGQAVALHVEGDKFIARNCHILGNQDTLYTAKEESRQYYENCLIEGTTDFIFGEATCVFQSCTIRSLTNSYITASAQRQSQKFGYVFFDCKLVAAPGATKVFLGRPWRPYAKTVFIRTEMGEHIVPEGWHHWPGDKMFPDKEKTAFYAEYQSKGAGANAASRVAWSRQLSRKEAKQYTLEKIFKGTETWKVTPAGKN